MQSRFLHLKKKVLVMRTAGKSLREIEAVLGVPRSTLSGWIKPITLTAKQQAKLKLQWHDGLKRSRIQAGLWHKEQKRLRLVNAKNAADNLLKQLKYTPLDIEIALAFLYLGEGAKKSSNTSLGNSNPLILKFFISCLRKLYNVPLADIRCELHLRADQNPTEIKKYWAKELGLPLSSFYGASIDRRTAGRPTYPDYKGVCVVRCGRVALVRRLMYIADGFCNNVIVKPSP